MVSLPIYWLAKVSSFLTLCKKWCLKVAKSFLLIEFGVPIDSHMAFVDSVDQNGILVFQTLKISLLFFRKVGKLVIKIKFVNVMAAFLIEKSIDANWPSGILHFDLCLVCVSYASFPVVSDWCDPSFF